MFHSKVLRSRYTVTLFKWRKLKTFFKILYVAKSRRKKGKKREATKQTMERKEMGKKGGKKKREESSRLCSGDHLLEGAGIADGDRREVHGLKAHGEGDADLPAQVGLDEDAPLPAHQAGEEQREQEPHGFLLGALADDAFRAVCVGVVTVPHEKLLVGVARALLQPVQALQQVLLYWHGGTCWDMGCHQIGDC